jgi:hypothetical protein
MSSRTIVVAIAGLLLTACQAAQTSSISAQPTPPPTPIDGRWTSEDGAFIVSFSEGRFTTTRVRSGHVLARGWYAMVDDKIEMQWVSQNEKENRSAVCSMESPSAARCLQDGVGHFDIRRLV